MTLVIKSLFIVLIYICLRILPDLSFWRNYSEYYSYGFEILFILWSGWVIQKKPTLKLTFKSKDLLNSALFFLCGTAVLIIARSLSIIVPFDFKHTETIVLLLIAGPILEEALFRFALWEPFKILTHSKT